MTYNLMHRNNSRLTDTQFSQTHRPVILPVSRDLRKKLFLVACDVSEYCLPFFC